MRLVLSIDIAKCKNIIMLSTEHGEVLMFMEQFLNVHENFKKMPIFVILVVV